MAGGGIGRRLDGKTAEGSKDMKAGWPPQVVETGDRKPHTHSHLGCKSLASLSSPRLCPEINDISFKEERVTSERVLGVDYVVLQGHGSRQYQNGATSADGEMHLSIDAGQTTICGAMVKEYMLTYEDVEITCRDCIEILKRKSGGVR